MSVRGPYSDRSPTRRGRTHRTVRRRPLSARALVAILLAIPGRRRHGRAPRGFGAFRPRATYQRERADVFPRCDDLSEYVPVSDVMLLEDYTEKPRTCPTWCGGTACKSRSSALNAAGRAAHKQFAGTFGGSGQIRAAYAFAGELETFSQFEG
jgi:hypothetical protein